MSRRWAIPFKFERLEVWQLAMQYVDVAYALAGGLPRSEEYNLGSQLRRAATSVALNIAEGSTGQSNAEQARFLGLAIRSLLETVACQHLIRRRAYPVDPALLEGAYAAADVLARKLQAMRRSLAEPSRLREAGPGYMLPAGDEVLI